jgi:hypothetical protein
MELIAKCDSITMLTAVCSVCGRTASFTAHKGIMDGPIKIGDIGEYIPMCRQCFFDWLEKKSAPKDTINESDGELIAESDDYDFDYGEDSDDPDSDDDDDGFFGYGALSAPDIIECTRVAEEEEKEKALEKEVSSQSNDGKAM